MPSKTAATVMIVSSGVVTPEDDVIIGEVRDFAFAGTPTGWLPCDGAAVSRVTYAALFAVIGTGWGAGDGINTFNVPDLRGRVIAGDGTGPGLTARVVGDTFGEETHQLALTEIPAHDHGFNDPGHNHTEIADGGGAGDGLQSIRGSSGASTGTLANVTDTDSTGITFNSAGSSLAHNNLQPTGVCRKAIYAGV